MTPRHTPTPATVEVPVGESGLAYLHAFLADAGSPTAQALLRLVPWARGETFAILPPGTADARREAFTVGGLLPTPTGQVVEKAFYKQANVALVRALRAAGDGLVVFDDPAARRAEHPVRLAAAHGARVP